MRIHAIPVVPLSGAHKDRLRALGELHCYDAVLGDANVGELCRGAEALLITPRLAADIMPCLDRCRLISVQAAGVDAINLPAAREKGVTVCNVPDFCSDAVAEHAFALLLAVAKRIEEGRPLLRAGRWRTALAYPTLGLRGKTLGLFGCGKIGSRIAEIARGFGMETVAAVRDPARPRPVSAVSFERLVAESDFLVLAAPATPGTRSIFNRDAFEKMKPGVALVNISRGALIDHAALLAALDEGRLAGAGIDVFVQEPPGPEDPLLSHPKAVVSPHVAWGAEDAVERLLDLSIANIEAFAAGRPVNVVS